MSRDPTQRWSINSETQPLLPFSCAVVGLFQTFPSAEQISKNAAKRELEEKKQMELKEKLSPTWEALWQPSASEDHISVIKHCIQARIIALQENHTLPADLGTIIVLDPVISSKANLSQLPYSNEETDVAILPVKLDQPENNIQEWGGIIFRKNSKPEVIETTNSDFPFSHQSGRRPEFRILELAFDLANKACCYVEPSLPRSRSLSAIFFADIISAKNPISRAFLEELQEKNSRPQIAENHCCVML